MRLGGNGHAEYTYSRPLYISVFGNGKIRIHGSGFHYLRCGATINVGNNAILEIGNNFSVSNDLRLHVTNHVKIGDNNMWSYNIIVLDSDVHKIFDENHKLINSLGKITFGENVWIGCRCTIIKNSIIPDGCIIGSNTVVKKNLAEKRAIYAGPNARCVKSDIYWSREYLQ